MEEEKESVGRGNGCIKTTRGPWIVRRRGKGGAISHSWRRPTDRERESNRVREQHRRRVARKIYAGLWQHGNYRLQKHPDRNDILIALCEEAGYRVDQDGTILGKKSDNGEPSGTAKSLESAAINSNNSPSRCEIRMQPEMEGDDISLDLTISFKYM